VDNALTGKKIKCTKRLASNFNEERTSYATPAFVKHLQVEGLIENAVDAVPLEELPLRQRQSLAKRCTAMLHHNPHVQSRLHPCKCLHNIAHAQIRIVLCVTQEFRHTRIASRSSLERLAARI
jgi:hypothetical protein